MNKPILIAGESFDSNRMRHITIQDKLDKVQIEFSYVGEKIKTFLGHTGRDVCLKRILVPPDEADCIVEQLEKISKRHRWRYGKR